MKHLTKKTVTLLAITTAARCSEIALIDVRYIDNQGDNYHNLLCQIGHSKTWNKVNKRSTKPIIISYYRDNTLLCSASTKDVPEQNKRAETN